MSIKAIMEVVTNKWCIGCGVCAGTCPKDILEMKFNDFGEYNPFERNIEQNCAQGCNICYQVCPAHGNSKNETEIGNDNFGNIKNINYNDKIGYYINNFVGYSKVGDHRQNGASGGMATWTLESLLKLDIVDAVACVGKSEEIDKQFEFKLCTTIEELRLCSSSAYYPNEISKIIKYIMENNGRYAIIGLPCVCKAIRLAQDRYPKLKKRIRFVLGLVCGHSVSKSFLEYLVAKSGGNPLNINDFRFRQKDEHLEAKKSFNRYFFKSTSCNSITEGYDQFDFEWGEGHFKPIGCFFCDDIFAECADATFFDAWINSYFKDPKGNNLIIIRNQFLNKLYNKNSIETHVSKIEINKVLKSQKSAIILKRRSIITFINYAKKNHLHTPKLRFNLLKNNLNLFQRLIDENIYKTAQLSAIKWEETNKNILKFNESLIPVHITMNRYHRLKQIFSLSLPFLVTRKVYNLIVKG